MISFCKGKEQANMLKSRKSSLIFIILEVIVILGYTLKLIRYLVSLRKKYFKIEIIDVI